MAPQNPFKRMWVDNMGNSTPHDIMVSAEIDPRAMVVNLVIGKAQLIVDLAVVQCGGNIRVRTGDNLVSYPNMHALEAAWGTEIQPQPARKEKPLPGKNKRADMCSRFLYEK
jgi:hypothetical protein